uniref:Doublecortin domain-containing protein n=1 Tax=Parastrongyloides trichosuri TaxID=131310 RepID=A0A0N5A2S1_PARTI
MGRVMYNKPSWERLNPNGTIFLRRLNRRYEDKVGSIIGTVTEKINTEFAEKIVNYNHKDNAPMYFRVKIDNSTLLKTKVDKQFIEWVCSNRVCYNPSRYLLHVMPNRCVFYGTTLTPSFEGFKKYEQKIKKRLPKNFKITKKDGKVIYFPYLKFVAEKGEENTIHKIMMKNYILFLLFSLIVITVITGNDTTTVSGESETTTVGGTTQETSKKVDTTDTTKKEDVTSTTDSTKNTDTTATTKKDNNESTSVKETSTATTKKDEKLSTVANSDKPSTTVKSDTTKSESTTKKEESKKEEGEDDSKKKKINVVFSVVGRVLADDERFQKDYLLVLRKRIKNKNIDNEKEKLGSIYKVVKLPKDRNFVEKINVKGYVENSKIMVEVILQEKSPKNVGMKMLPDKCNSSPCPNTPYKSRYAYMCTAYIRKYRTKVGVKANASIYENYDIEYKGDQKKYVYLPFIDINVLEEDNFLGDKKFEKIEDYCEGLFVDPDFA